MKGDRKAIDFLNRYLVTELTGHHQYIGHARMLKNWGVTGLAEREDQYAEEERAHAARIADRILFLEGTPDFRTIGTLAIGTDVKELLTGDLGLVRQAQTVLRAGVAHCESAADYVSRDLLREMLDDEEQHAHWLEVQLALIARIGLKNYIQSRGG